MAEAFDAYYKWLGIPPREQPPNHYRLLAINLFEDDLDVIDAAADRQMSHLRNYQTGQHSAASQKLLNECSAARITLLNPQSKAEYDRQLREKQQAASGASVGNALRGVPGVASEPAPLSNRVRSEGGSPRSVPQAKPLPQSQSPVFDKMVNVAASRLVDGPRPVAVLPRKVTATLLAV